MLMKLFFYVVLFFGIYVLVYVYYECMLEELIFIGELVDDYWVILIGEFYGMREMFVVFFYIVDELIEVEWLVVIVIEYKVIF